MSTSSSTHNHKTAVLILNYRGVNDTIECVKSVKNQSLASFATVVIDNGSNDGSYEKLKEYKDKSKADFTLIKSERNLGFAGGVNIGIRYALDRKFEYIALLNNDAKPHPDWLKYLMETMDSSKDIGAATCLLLHQDGKTIDSTGEQFSTWGLAFPRDRNRTTNLAHTGGLTFGATGGASLYRLAMLKDIGLFDEHFFLYYEDLDVSFRAQLASWKVSYNPSAVAYHKQGASTSKIPGLQVYSHFKNTPLVIVKNVPASLLLDIGGRFMIAYTMMLSNAIAKGNGVPAIKGWLASIPLFWLHALPARFKIQRERKVSSNYIQSILWSDLPPDQTGLRKFRSFFTGKK